MRLPDLAAPVCFVVCLLVLGAPRVHAQGLAPVSARTDLSAVPDDGLWTQIGTGSVIPYEGMIVCNDNAADEYIAFQGHLGALEREHRIDVRASVRVLTNIGGQAAVLEVSRPGLELVVQLFPDRIAVTEREGRDIRWLATAPASLAQETEIRIRKESSVDDARETLTVWVGGDLVLQTSGRGVGTLGVGRIVFGSLGYASLGASAWRWIEVEAVPVVADPVVDTEPASFGQLKSRFGQR